MQLKITHILVFVLLSLVGLYLLTLFTFGFLLYFLPTSYASFFFVFGALSLSLYFAFDDFLPVIIIGFFFALIAGALVGTTWELHFFTFILYCFFFLCSCSALSRFMALTPFKGCVLCILLSCFTSLFLHYLATGDFFELQSIVHFMIVCGFFCYPLRVMIDIWIALIRKFMTKAVI